MEILKLNAKVRLGELSGTITNVTEAHNEKSEISNDSTLSMLINELINTNNKFTAAYNQDKVLSELENFDEQRDAAMRSVYHYVQGCTHLPQGNTATAAHKVFTLLTKYGIGIVSQSYNQQTGEINSLLNDLSMPDNAEAVATIPSLSDMVASLHEAQRNFEQAYAQFLARSSDNKLNASDIKPQLLNILNNKLVVYLRSQVIFNPETYNAFAAKVATAINRTNSNIKERTAKNSKEDNSGELKDSSIKT
ncbi:MAG: DUF6261 family protein [Halanaerobiales bacterium]|nr:DUF6261 family protein [Halanaerobiales bacterium]